MAFVRALVLACAAASCAAFNPAVSAFGRVGSLRKSVSYAPAARTAPLSNHRAASASQIAMKGYEIDLTGKVLPLLVFCNPSLLSQRFECKPASNSKWLKVFFAPVLCMCACVCVSGHVLIGRLHWRSWGCKWLRLGYREAACQCWCHHRYRNMAPGAHAF